MDKQAANIKLTPRQKEVVKKLQEGWVFITGSDFGAILSKGYENEQIRLNLFFNLVKKGIIWQEHEHYNYILSDLGREIKII
jgi:hypothetical protein